jgi:nucleoside-diphosphate-sugar epimerase
MQSGRPILVTGAGGFIGRDLVLRMVARGLYVRAMLRPGAESPFPPHERLQIVHADLRDGDTLVPAVRDCAAVVHLAAAKADEKDSEDVNVGGARRLVRACELADCRRLINISTQSTKISRKGIYARTKREADEVFHGSGLDVTSLLPSVVYGETKGGVFGMILQFVQKSPIVVVLGDGKWVCAPVYVGDITAAVIACLGTPRTIGNMYDVGGPDVVSFDDLIDRIAAATGRCPPKLHVPFTIALWIARAVARLPKAPITVSNVLGSNQDTLIDIGPARRDFGFDPLGLDAGLKIAVDTNGHGQAAIENRPVQPENDIQLARDCRVISCYLIDREPTNDLIERYCAAMRLRLPDSDGDDAEWRWARRYPRVLPYLDAAAALVRPRSSLRQRIYLMAAILETAPAHAEQFLPPTRTTAGLIAGLIWNASRATVNAAIGLPLQAWARRFG